MTQMPDDDRVSRDDLHRRIHDLKIELGQRELQVRDYASQIAQIRAALNEVAVYEGQVEGGPVAAMVRDLARDHEALEGRIENVLTYVQNAQSLTIQRNQVGLYDLAKIADLLRGGSPVPDTLEGLDG